MSPLVLSLQSTQEGREYGVLRTTQEAINYIPPEQYYGQPAHVMRARQMSFAGPAAGLQAWLKGYVAAGVSHIVLRFAGDHERHLKTLAQMRDKIAG